MKMISPIMRRHHHRHRTLAAAAALACCTLSLIPHPASAVQYSLIDLSAFGPADTYATSINNAGQIIGTFSFPGDPTFHDFLLNPNSPPITLGDSPGSSSTTPNAINDAGQVVGYVTYPTNDTRAFLFTPPASMSNLPTLFPSVSKASAINSSGQIAGSFAPSTFDPVHAFVLPSPYSAPVDLGTLGGPSSRATGINDAGLVVGTADTLPGPAHAFLFSPSTGMSDLGTLAGLPFLSSSASAINSLGQIVGSSDTLAGPSHAFLFSPTTGMTDLGSLYDGASAALALNASTQIVGTSAGRAFLWSDGHMLDLNSLTPSLFPGWTLTSATGINDAGQIVAQATIEGGGPARSLLLTPIPVSQSWTGAAGTTDFSSPNNWNPNTAPDAFSDLTILGWGQTLSLSSPSSARSLTADGTLTLDLASHPLSITHDLRLATYISGATLTLSNGPVSADRVFLAGTPEQGPLSPGISNTLRLASASLTATTSVTVYDFGTLQLSANSSLTAPLLSLAGTLDAAAGTNTVSAPVQIAPTVYPPTLSASSPDATLVLTGNLSDPRAGGPIFQAQGPGTIELRGNNSLNMFAVNPATTLHLAAGSTHAANLFVYGTLLASDTSVSLDGALSVFPLTAANPATVELRPGSSLSANNVFLDGTGGGTATLRIAGGSLSATNYLGLNVNGLNSPNVDTTPVHVEHSAGSVTANTLNLGGLVPATYSLSGGSLSAQQETIANASTFTQSGGSHAVAGTLYLPSSSTYAQSGGSLSVAGSLILTDSATYSLSAGTLAASTLSLTRTGPGPGVHQTGGAATLSQLSLTTPYDYDLAAGTLTLAAPANLPTLPTYLRNHLLYTSSPTATLGYLLNPTDNTITVKPTTPGDANLDGSLTPDDYALLDRSFALNTPNAHWWNGDFNYDGHVDAQDYLIIDRSLGQAQGFSPGVLSQRESQFGADYVHELLTSVPEPASLALLSLTLPLLSRRRRPTPRT